MDAWRRLCREFLMLRNLCVLLLTFLFTSSVARAQTPRSEEELQAAYVYQFLSYITWPQGTGQEILIGVWENEVMLKHFEKILSDRNSPDRVVRAMALSGQTVPPETDLIFAEKIRPAAFEALTKAINQRNVLVVSPHEAHYRRGASIYLFSESGKLRFSVDRKYLEARDFKVSSQLLRLAKKVD